MTRRSDKQQDRTHFYVPDGGAGEVWVIEADECEGLWGLAVFANEQIAAQYADWLAKAHHLTVSPHPRRMPIRTCMKEVA